MNRIRSFRLPRYKDGSVKTFVEKNRYYLYLLLLVIVAEIIINPLGNFPLNDDWSYAQTLNIFYREGRIFLGNWPAMSLYTQILWGFVFEKVFGISFFVLRCSTLVSALIGYAFLYRLIVQISGNKPLALLGCLVLVFNPMVFNLSNTFMTDVNFNTLFIICCYFMYNFFTTQKLRYYLCFVLFSTALILQRQYGIIFPLCFLISGFFVKEKKLKTMILAVISFIIVAGALKLYEDYLKGNMPPGAAYKFSGNIKMNSEFFKMLFSSITIRHQKTIIYTLTYAMPFAVIFLRAAVKQAGWMINIVMGTIALLITYYLFSTDTFDSPSVLWNMRLGDEVFLGSYRDVRHNTFPRFTTYITIINFISSVITLFVLFVNLFSIGKARAVKKLFKPEIIFMILLGLAYTFMVMITESYFDRYHIPLITTLIILFSYLGKFREIRFRLAVIPLLFWAYVSMAGTHDYLEWNRQRWKAYWYLRTEMKIPAMRINGGFEVCCWQEGRGQGYVDYRDMTNYRYLIQFTPQPGFRLIKELEFQRYFPYKKDKMYIFVKEDDHTKDKES